MDTVSDFTELIEDAVANETGKFDLMTLVKLAMSVIEFGLHVAKKDVAGEKKLELAKKIVPDVIDVAISAKKMDPEEGAELKNKIMSGVDIVSDVAEFIIGLTNNPNLIQFGKWMEAQCKTCCVPKKQK